jgi:hypothetical protein
MGKTVIINKVNVTSSRPEIQSKLFNCGYGAYGRNGSMPETVNGYRKGKV